MSVRRFAVTLEHSLLTL